VLFLKTFKDAVFAVDGSALQTFITLSSEKLLSNASCAPSLKTVCTVVVMTWLVVGEAD